MANFCASCGSPSAAGKTFCPGCGAPQQPQAPVPVQAPPPAVAAPAKNGGGALKILLVVFVCFFGLIVLAGAGVWYAAHKVKQAAVAKAHELGVELPGSSAHANLPEVQVCDLLPKEEVAKLLGAPIERAEKSPGGCAYFGAAGASSKMADDQISNTLHRASKSNGADTAAGMSDLVTNLASASQAAAGRDDALLRVIVGNDGRAQMTAMTATKAIFSGIGGGIGSEVPNLGERAVMMANLGLNVLQGDRIIRIIPGPVTAPKDKSIAVARVVLARL